MKLLVVTCTLGLTIASGGAMAACTGTPLNAAELSTTLRGNTVCVGTAGNWEAQELHQSSGRLIDFKRGPGHPVDPTEQVGTWTVNSQGTVTHDYGSGGSYTYSLYRNGGTSYSFCSAAPEIVANIKSGGGGCP